MNKIFQPIRGMKDYFSKELILWDYAKKKIVQIFNSHCFEKIKTPILEKSELFKRTIGNITDIIEKEMYSFVDKRKNSLALRPEATVGCMRAAINQNVFYRSKEQRFWYCGPMFRYERPQKGRHRQFHQIGSEIFGLPGFETDLELITITEKLWRKLGILKKVTLEINSIGSIFARNKYKKSLVDFLKKNQKFLDSYSINRINKNPLRILDSKNKDTQKLLKTAPVLINYLEEKSLVRFKKLCKCMKLHNIAYKINNFLVRGLDYYNDTVFEWKSNELGSQNTFCAGGRYDGLAEQLGGGNIPAIGFSIGIERLVELLKKFLPIKKNKKNIDMLIFFLQKEDQFKTFQLSEELRKIFPNLRIKLSAFVKNIKKSINREKKRNNFMILLCESYINKQSFILFKKKVKEKKVRVTRKKLVDLISSFL